MLRRLIGTVFALALLGSTTSALASTRKPLYRTDHQAERYLKYGLKSWAHTELGRTNLRAAFCISGASARPADKHYPQGRSNRSGDPVYRTFACTLNAAVNGRTRVFGLYLVATHSGWRITALH